ncbi:MAG: hypothetical protein K8F25_10675 [Fimbriimonadaceae bacterium]|nr:hypothetical protein [Alphaproteobacteria bacterium]
MAVWRILAAILSEKRVQKDENAVMIAGLFIELVAMLVSARKGIIELVNPDAIETVRLSAVLPI